MPKVAAAAGLGRTDEHARARFQNLRTALTETKRRRDKRYHQPRRRHAYRRCSRVSRLIPLPVPEPAMHIQRGRPEEIPPDAIRLTKIEVFQYMTDLIRKWPSTSEVYVCRRLSLAAGRFFTCLFSVSDGR